MRWLSFAACAWLSVLFSLQQGTDPLPPGILATASSLLVVLAAVRRSLTRGAGK